MSKERLEELHKFYINGTLSAEELIEEVVELEWINEVLINQNKRYREALEEILAEAYEEAGVHPDTDMQLETFIAKKARKALEGEE